MTIIFRTFLCFAALFSTSLAQADILHEDQAFWKKVHDYGTAKTEINRLEIEKQLWATYGKSTTVVVIDTSGFTLRSLDEGIISTLVVIEELRNIISEIIRDTPQGAIIKFDADNAFLTFDSPDDAIVCIKKIRGALAKSYINQGHKHPIYISTGIGYGQILRLSNDAFSKTLNIASKLGEDTANADEILLTDEAYKALKKPVKAQENSVTISNVQIKYYKIID